MNCEQFQAILDDFLAGTLDDEISARRHLKSCGPCRELVSILRDDLEIPLVPAPAGLAEAVLRRTSGPACETARESLPGYADGDLPEGDTELLAIHLEGCRDCRGLVAAVRMLAADLPSLAEMEPAPDFMAQVLAETSLKQTLAQRFAASWQGMLRRPRFAFEAAYVAAITFVLLFGLPFTGDGGGRVLEMARMQPVQTLFATDGPLADAVRGTVEYTEQLSAHTTRGAKETMNSRAEEVTGWLQEYREGVRQRWTTGTPAPDQPENGIEPKEIEP